jgi:hypothetical protein
MSEQTRAPMDKQQIRELLPFYVNQTLPQDQRAWVQAGLARHPELQPELDWLEAMRIDWQHQPIDALPPGDFGWSVFSAKIAQRKLQAPALPSLWGRLGEWLHNNFAPVLATACLVLVVQGLAIGWLMREQGTYTAAGGVSAPGAQRGLTVRVTIRPEVTEPKLRETLRRLDAAIVQGPSALGVYVLALPEGAAGTADASVLTALERVRAEGRDVFESVTP